jgi:hypothetical protein
MQIKPARESRIAIEASSASRKSVKPSWSKYRFRAI